MATTQTKQMTARERAIAKAKEVDPYCQRLNTYSWCVNGMLDGVRYIVTLASGGELEGAACTCQGKDHPYCYHRAAAFLRFQDWRWTEQGQKWEADYYCAECHIYAKAAHSDYCQACLNLEEESRLAVTRWMVGKGFEDLIEGALLPDPRLYNGKTAAQVLMEERDLYA